MSMPEQLFSTAFRRQHLGLMFFVIMVLMVYLGSLAMAAQATLARTSLTWGHNLENRVTIEIPAAPELTTDEQREREDKILSFLHNLSEVRHISTLPQSETARLVEPWVSDPDLLKALPLPTLVDADLKTDQEMDLDKLEASLDKEVSGVRVHSHATWMNELLGFLRGLGVLSIIMLALTALTIVVTISVICRAAMAVQHETIELLHFMGANDDAIARQFQVHIRRVSIPSSLIGFIGAVLTVLVLAFLLSSLGGISLIANSSWVTVGVVMAFVPLCASLLAIVTARYAVLKLLRRLS